MFIREGGGGGLDKSLKYTIGRIVPSVLLLLELLFGNETLNFVLEGHHEQG